ncbi:fungal peroxidase [Armillaria mellea]|nr:fungal peroxidase [Armillaria mellea]
MKTSGAISASLLFLSLVFNAAGRPNHADQLQRRRTTSILNNPAPQPDLPTVQEAQAAAATVDLNLDDIQADILVGMKKKKELFFFFGIQNATDFKSKLVTDIHPLITSTTQILDVTTQPLTAVNIAFSQSGLTALGITDDLGDQFYSTGQEADSAAIGDPGTGSWVQSFAGTSVHGVFLLASDTIDNVNQTLSDLLSSLGDSIGELHRVQGEARPGSEEGHEHFGYMDGISQPAPVDAGEILLAEDGDSITRPSWAKDGTFLVFRQMEQLRPRVQQEGSALLGARMVGRWKSGAPVDLVPLFDDPTLAADPTRNNNFTYLHDDQSSTNQTRCPFSAHTRKTRPRGDFTPENTANHIIRAGIPYGPEVTDEEAASNTTSASLERGLAFVAYQSNINQGFRFLQQFWVNNANFFQAGTGVDPIIGSAGTNPSSRSRPVTGLDPTDLGRAITLQNDFVVSRGGEYFFSPSISAILNTIAA